MSEQNETPDLMLELLENAGYSLVFQYDKNHARAYGYWFLCTPDEWELSSSSGFKDTNKMSAWKHSLIKQAYAHYQQAQEVERLRARVVELEQKLDDCESGWEMIGY